jgi:hypothetical protein
VTLIDGFDGSLPPYLATLCFLSLNDQLIHIEMVCNTCSVHRRFPANGIVIVCFALAFTVLMEERIHREAGGGKAPR